MVAPLYRKQKNTAMNHQKLGKSVLEVSAIGFDCMGLSFGFGRAAKITSNKKYNSMKTTILGLFIIMSVNWSFAQNSADEQEIINLSKEKWHWMTDKNVDKLAPLFHDKSKFVHMSGTWKKDEELDIIKTGSIWYKKTDVHDVAVEMFKDTAILWSRITLQAVVRGSEVSTEFTVTEVYQKEKKVWKLLALTFSSVRDTHVIKH
jgi:Domain of unknown function (DUF4440)